MLENIPDREELAALLGPALYEVWMGLCAAIDAKYEMERLWNTGGKNWQYEYKYRRGGKTLCALYAREGCAGFMVIFGKAERDKFEALQDSFPAQIQTAYAKAQTFHDGLCLSLKVQNCWTITCVCWQSSGSRIENRALVLRKERVKLMQLETERLILREMVPSDFDALYKVWGDRDIMQHYPYTFDEKRVREWIQRNMERY